MLRESRYVRRRCSRHWACVSRLEAIKGVISARDCNRLHARAPPSRALGEGVGLAPAFPRRRARAAARPVDPKGCRREPGLHAVQCDGGRPAGAEPAATGDRQRQHRRVGVARRRQRRRGAAVRPVRAPPGDDRGRCRLSRLRARHLPARRDRYGRRRHPRDHARVPRDGLPGRHAAGLPCLPAAAPRDRASTGRGGGGEGRAGLVLPAPAVLRPVQPVGGAAMSSELIRTDRSRCEFHHLSGSGATNRFSVR
jgi:hypothetical protein